MQTQIGWHASHELYPPSRLLKILQQAERAGFGAASCSDHFHPWSEKEGQSGFAWSWLGAALASTSLPMGAVCAPGQRYHPAIVAQAVATLLEMYPGRFWIAAGSGEALNESITGEPWPAKPSRNARLKESVDIMRALWKGETVTHSGLIHVRQARLFTRPREMPQVIGAALTPETARWLGGWADGLITAGRNHEDLQKVIDAFREGGGEGKPLYLQAAVSYAKTDEEAQRIAYQRWPHAGLELPQLADLSTPAAFDAATDSVTPDVIGQRLRCSADLQRHAEWLRGDLELGFTGVFLHYVGEGLEDFVELFSEKVIPSVVK